MVRTIIPCIILTVIFLTACKPESENEVTTILLAINIWNEKTENAIHFEVVPFGQEEISIIKSDTKDFRGATVPKRCIFLADVSLRTVLHELGHVCGLIHEHQRLDRDSYIFVNFVEVFKTLGLLGIYSFEKTTPGRYDYKKYPYDYRSIMHYNQEDVGDCILSFGHMLGNEVLSDIDIQKVKDIYAKSPRTVKIALYGFSL